MGHQFGPLQVILFIGFTIPLCSQPRTYTPEVNLGLGVQVIEEKGRAKTLRGDISVVPIDGAGVTYSMEFSRAIQILSRDDRGYADISDSGALLIGYEIPIVSANEFWSSIIRAEAGIGLIEFKEYYSTRTGKAVSRYRTRSFPVTISIIGRINWRLRTGVELFGNLNKRAKMVGMQLVLSYEIYKDRNEL